MQVGYEKFTILDEYLVDHCWTVTCDQYLDGPVQVIASEHHLSRATNKCRQATHQ